ncbi:MAG: hypothetical protein Kow0089_11940 [Desulfobulbaceae bacterium]
MPRMTRKIFKALLPLTVALLLPALLVEPDGAVGSPVKDASWRTTFAIYRNVPCLTAEELEYGAEVIAGLDYNSSRVFRRMCTMEGMNFEKSKEAWSTLTGEHLSFEQVLSYEEWSIPGPVHIDLGLAAVKAIGSLGYEAGRSFRGYCLLPDVSPEHTLEVIPLLKRLSEAQNRAFQGLLSLTDLQATQALDSLGFISRMDYYQARAADSLAGVPDMTTSQVMEALPLIRMLNMENAWNAATLYSMPEITPEKAWFWLVTFFANPRDIQERQFYGLAPADREILVRAFYRGGEELIWKINNLHAITDRFGLEISRRTLARVDHTWIRDRFAQLSPETRAAFSSSMYGSSSKNRMIAILRQAVAAERKATARRLIGADIYALLSQGSELYDSSFRNILVPVLKEEIDRNFSGNLLAFLRAADPANILVSDFIVSLAQKGKLTTFFPEDSREQEQILDLVAASAFRDEDAVILFSATFMHLLEVLEPSARSFLIRRMAARAEEGNPTLTRLITVILQYYLEEFPDLLSDADRSSIARLIVRHGAVNLLQYIATPFFDWKEDNTLSSLSLFHPDDDGMDSFRSNARILMDSGYTLDFSDQFTVAPLDAPARKRAETAVRKARRGGGKGLAELFNAMQRDRFAVAFTRAVNNITISHAATIYSDESTQERLLERFLLSGAEMLAQRGHSYWRAEQLIDPLERLMQQGRITTDDLRARQRFLSLGSCGGVKAFSSLNRLFQGSVDILATIGTGLASINDPYNKTFFETVARNTAAMTWKDMARNLAFIFKGGHGRDYLQPGSLPSILHKLLDEEKNRAKERSTGQNIPELNDDTTG